MRKLPIVYASAAAVVFGIVLWITAPDSKPERPVSDEDVYPTAMLARVAPPSAAGAAQDAAPSLMAYLGLAKPFQGMPFADRPGIGGSLSGATGLALAGRTAVLPAITDLAKLFGAAGIPSAMELALLETDASGRTAAGAAIERFEARASSVGDAELPVVVPDPTLPPVAALPPPATEAPPVVEVPQLPPDGPMDPGTPPPPTVSPVPEPAIWMQLIAGFALLGGLLRRDGWRRGAKLR